MKPTKSLLVIGYGDREKSDEGAGCRIAEIIQQNNWKDIDGLSVPYLTPSLSSLMIRAKTVIFVSSYFLFEKMKPEIMIKHFLPDDKKDETNLDHPEPPFSLLSFTESIYNKKPNAFWILIPAINYQKGEDFSLSTQAAIQDTMTYLAGKNLIQSLNPSG